jgi:hypothetical protein
MKTVGDGGFLVSHDPVVDGLPVTAQPDRYKLCACGSLCRKRIHGEQLPAFNSTGFAARGFLGIEFVARWMCIGVAPQTPQTSTAISTSPGPGSGIGRVTRSRVPGVVTSMAG